MATPSPSSQRRPGRGSGRGARLAVAAAVGALGAGVLAGCSAGDAPHVIGTPTTTTPSTAAPTTVVTSVPTTSVTVAPTSATGSTPSTGTTTTLAPDAGLPSQTSVNNVEAELQQLSNSLNQANSDLNSTHGDN